MGALDNAKRMSSEEVMNKIAALNIQEYGLCHGPLFEHLQANAYTSGVVCALNNADTDGVLLEVLTENPQKVMEGISIVSYALGSEKKVLHIPEYAADIADAIAEAAAAYQVELVIGMVDVRASDTSALIHLVTAANLADCFAGKEEPLLYISVNGAPVKGFAGDTTIAQLADCTEAKALLLGYQLFQPDAAEKTIGEMPIDNGVVRVLTAKDCVVSATEKHLTASRQQSCGKCVFCREGLLQLQYMQKEITNGKGKNEYLEMTKEIGTAMTFSTPCTMGQTAAKIALSAIACFEAEYEAHIKKKTCPAGVCFQTETMYIDPKLCNGCEECMDVCPEDCIEGKANYIHMIDAFDCILCGKCAEVCEEAAVIKTSGKVPKLPNRLTKVGKFKR